MENLEKTPGQKRAEKLIKKYRKNEVKLAKQTLKDASRLDYEYDAVESIERLERLNYALIQFGLHREELLADIERYYKPDIIKGDNEELLNRKNMLTSVINLAAVCRVELLYFDAKYDSDKYALRNYIKNPPTETTDTNL